MSWFKHNCATDGHDFQPRFNEKPNPKFSGSGEEMLKMFLYYKVYIYDICTKCGQKITKPGDGK